MPQEGTISTVHPALDPQSVRAAMDGIIRTNPGDADKFEAWLPTPVPQSHAANLLELANGDLGCVWFAGSQEGRGDVCIFFARLPKGSDRWSEPVRLTEDMDRSEQNPFLFQTSEGRLFVIYTAQIAGDQATALIRYRVSDDNGETFGPVTQLVDEIGTFVRHPIVVNGAGEWLLPVFLCTAPEGKRWRGHRDTSAVRISDDQGKTWSKVDVPDSLGAVHMCIVPLEGNRMAAFYRSRFADNVYRSESDDGGHTWSAPTALDLPNNNASIQVVRLKSGRLAIVYNHISARDSSDRRDGLYDEITPKWENEDTPGPGEPRAIWGAPRAPMTIALSEDDGLTFPIRRDIDVGDGHCLTNNSTDKQNREFSYPTVFQDSDGMINIAFTYYRQAIKHVRVSEDWVLAARPD